MNRDACEKSLYCIEEKLCSSDISDSEKQELIKERKRLIREVRIN